MTLKRRHNIILNAFMLIMAISACSYSMSEELEFTKTKNSSMRYLISAPLGVIYSGELNDFKGLMSLDNKCGKLRCPLIKFAINMQEIVSDEHGRLDESSIIYGLMNNSNDTGAYFNSENVLFEPNLNGYIIQGDLTLNGVTRKSALKAEIVSMLDDGGITHRALRGNITIVLSDYGITSLLLPSNQQAEIFLEISEKI